MRARTVNAVVVPLTCILFLGCGSGERASEQARTTADGVATMSPLEQASLAFEGNPTPREIQEKMDRAFGLYKLEPTNENYSRAGSTLVALRRENGVDEMDILDHMIRSHVEGVAVTFPQAAAISAVAIKVEDR